MNKKNVSIGEIHVNPQIKIPCIDDEQKKLHQFEWCMWTPKLKYLVSLINKKIYQLSWCMWTPKLKYLVFMMNKENVSILDMQVNPQTKIPSIHDEQKKLYQLGSCM